MNKFLDIYELPKLNWEGINNLNKFITSKESKIQWIVYKQKSPGWEGVTVEFYPATKEDLILILLKQDKGTLKKMKIIDQYSWWS